LGKVLVSKKGEGIIGMSYSVRGDAEQPHIFVNPLSVLTPGIFRRIFEGTPEAPKTIKPTIKPKSKPDAAGVVTKAAEGKKNVKADSAVRTQAPKENAPQSKPNATPEKVDATPPGKSAAATTDTQETAGAVKAKTADVDAAKAPSKPAAPDAAQPAAPKPTAPKTAAPDTAVPDASSQDTPPKPAPQK
jgi:hypothetical protein